MDQNTLETVLLEEYEALVLKLMQARRIVAEVELLARGRGVPTATKERIRDLYNHLFSIK